MLTLVTGGAASGKSEYAERLAAACDGPRVYIATMRPLDKGSVARIEKHRAVIEVVCGIPVIHKNEGERAG